MRLWRLTSPMIDRKDFCYILEATLKESKILRKNVLPNFYRRQVIGGTNVTFFLNLHIM